MPKGTRWSACTAQREDGSFCDGKTLPEAPFPICVNHAAQLYAFLKRNVDSDVAARKVARARVKSTSEAALRREKTYNQGGYIYYLAVGDLIKIGYTTDLGKRMRAYPPTTKVLAVEGGTKTTEQIIHRELRQHLVGRFEWYRPTAPVMERVNDARRRAGEAPLRIAA